jgi:hypothetical protein
MRYWLQTNKKLYSKIHALLIREIHRHYTNKAKSIGINDSTPGSISFTQRWGSALNLNPHAHVLCADGVYTWVNGKPRWNNMEKITDQDVSDLITKISQSVMRFLKKQDLSVHASLVAWFTNRNKATHYYPSHFARLQLKPRF